MKDAFEKQITEYSSLEDLFVEFENLEEGFNQTTKELFGNAIDNFEMEDIVSETSDKYGTFITIQLRNKLNEVIFWLTFDEDGNFRKIDAEVD